MDPIHISDQAQFSDQEVSDFIKSVFDESIALEYKPEGVKEFYDHISPSKINKRRAGNYQYQYATNTSSELIGITERDGGHLSGFFVKPESQRKGVGRKLLEAVIKTCKQESLRVDRITVNASPNAVAAYQALGFKKTDEERETKGIRFVPMALEI